MLKPTQGLLAAARAARLLFLPCAALLVSGCIAPTFYVDNKLGDMSAAQMHTVANPKPVQLLFEYQTKGATNSRATDQVRSEVVNTVKSSGLFSAVSTGPVDNGAVLNLVINDVPLEGSAGFGSGVTTGLTLGMVGSVAGDGLVCTANYVPGPGTPKITATEHHAVYTSIGMNSPVPNATKAKSGDEAVHTAVHQVVQHALNDLAADPGFTKK